MPATRRARQLTILLVAAALLVRDATNSRIDQTLVRAFPVR